MIKLKMSQPSHLDLASRSGTTARARRPQLRTWHRLLKLTLPRAQGPKGPSLLRPIRAPSRRTKVIQTCSLQQVPLRNQEINPGETRPWKAWARLKGFALEAPKTPNPSTGAFCRRMAKSTSSQRMETARKALAMSHDMMPCFPPN